MISFDVLFVFGFLFSFRNKSEMGAWLTEVSILHSFMYLVGKHFAKNFSYVYQEITSYDCNRFK